MGELGALVEAWRDRRDPRPSDAWIGRKVGARSRSTVGPWLAGDSMPSPTHLRRLAALIGVGYRTVLDAALLDAGYLEEREYRGDTAAMSDLEQARLMLVRELADATTVGELRAAAAGIAAPRPVDAPTSTPARVQVARGHLAAWRDGDATPMPDIEQMAAREGAIEDRDPDGQGPGGS